ncbi:MAG: SsrA-binding protein [Flavobacteriales bacterium]
MKLIFWTVLSRINKRILPKIHRRPDLLKLSLFDKAIVVWKIVVTYNYLDASSGRKVIKNNNG